MYPFSYRSPWKATLMVWFTAVLCLQFFPASTPNTESQALNSAQAASGFPQTTPPQVVVARPKLTPTYANGMCDSGWYRDYLDPTTPYFLALNVKNSGESEHSGTWTPDLPQDGVWEVEAYLPAHQPIPWNCPGLNVTTTWDTSHAVYTIYYLDESTTVAIDQAPLSDEWVSLGKYFFEQGTTGFVKLTDVTGESYHTRSVSFSRMRFTWISESFHPVYLPLNQREYPFVRLDSARTSAPDGHLEQAFFPGEAMHYVASGLNTTGAPAEARFTWSVAGPCAALENDASVATNLVSLQFGAWEHRLPASAPPCTGYFTYTLSMNYQGRVTTDSIPFIVSDPGAGTRLSVDAAFDRCDFPTESMLSNWWLSSPYRVVNMYIGGESRYCTNNYLTADNVGKAVRMGWSLIPTWVGPQPPCANFLHPMKPTPAETYPQGRSEADKAISAANNLGLPKDTVIYYDMEAYAGSTVTTTCRNAVKSFINGWVERLHERERKAGAYGSPRGSYMADWVTIPNVPDHVWIAVWYLPYQYDPDATVWVPNHLDNNLWANHQRIRQYTNSHTETWGGIPLTIDSNIIDGVVATVPQPLAGGVFQASPASWLQETQMLSATSGWALAGGRLLLTGDAGEGWRDITPSDENLAVESAYFLDESQGWLVARLAETEEPKLLRTADGGQSWQEWPLPASEETALGRVVSIQFVDSQVGWIALQLPSSSNFSLGRLLRTTDGGVTWEQHPLPLGAPTRFLDPRRGWVAGGPAGHELYATRDGGRTWQPAALPADLPAGEAFPGLPAFRDSSHGLLPVAFSGPGGARLVVFETSDAGESWRPASQISLGEAVVPGQAPLAASGAPNGLFALPGAGQVYRLEASQALAPLAAAGLPQGVLSLQVTPEGVGWARTASGDCWGSKPGSLETPPTSGPFQCQQRARLWLTTDGGLTWKEITPRS